MPVMAYARNTYPKCPHAAHADFRCPCRRQVWFGRLGLVTALLTGRPPRRFILAQVGAPLSPLDRRKE